MKKMKLALISTLALIAAAVSAQEPPNSRPRLHAPGEIQPPPQPQFAREPQGPKPPEAPLPPRAPEGERKRSETFGGGGGGGFGNEENPFDALSPLREMFGGGPSRPLLISATAVSAEVAAKFEEDLEVMSRILEKAVSRSSGQGPAQRYMGITIPGFSRNREAQSLYLDGYGALFILNVRFPLADDSGKQSDKSDDRSNSTWEQARREVQGGPQPPMPGRSMIYSEEKVQALKKELISELRNATNIRGLKSEDVIAVVVVGDDRAHEIGSRRLPARKLKTSPDNRNDPPHGEPEPSPRSTTLTLRVKKSDVDGFSKDKMDFETFQKKVTVTTY